MKTFRFTLQGCLLVIILLSVTALAQAAATRTWVASSPFGDDANPCSRTAPCATFAGAISKTNEGGEIDVIEPGSYGSVSIIKAITIDGGTGAGWASILASSSGTDGISVNVTSGNHMDDAGVTLRNLTINGAKQAAVGGHDGIHITKALQVHIENVNIENFNNTGINVDAGDDVSVWLKDVTFTKDNTAIRTTTSAGIIALYANHISVHGNKNGLHELANSFATIRDSFFGGTTGATNGAVSVGSTCQVNIENSMFTVNVVCLNVETGGLARISNNCFFNSSTALTGGGTIETATNTNKFSGNGSNGAPNAIITVQ